MERWQWELRKALKRWKLAILVTDKPVTLEQVELAANERGIRNVKSMSFQYLTPLSPETELKDHIMVALYNSRAPHCCAGSAMVAVMPLELLDYYRSWTGGWFIEYFESRACVISPITPYKGVMES